MVISQGQGQIRPIKSTQSINHVSTVVLVTSKTSTSSINSDKQSGWGEEIKRK